MNRPKWVKRNVSKYEKRLNFEKECLQKYFPSFDMKQEDDTTLFAEGQLVTLSNNIYSIKIYYPDNYPFMAPIALIMDKDVIEHCKSWNHGYHNYGIYKNGLRICVLKPDDEIGTGWRPDFSIIFIISLVAAWLHAFEVKKTTGKWILPEA